MWNVLRSAAYRIHQRYFTHATLFEGTLGGSSTSCRCLLAMPRDSLSETFLLGRIYGGSFRRIWRRRIWIPWLTRWARALPPDVDFCIASLPTRWDEVFASRCMLKGPPLVCQEIDLEGDWPDFKKRLHRKKRELLNRFLTRSPYDSRVSRDLAEFDHFYHRMYVPHAERQFEKEAKIDSYQRLRGVFERGFLLLLAEGGRDVAGSLCYVDGDRLVYHRGGVLDSSEEHVRNGAQAASYVAMFSQAKAMKLKRLDVGTSRAFFDDGVYRNKREWGASVRVGEDLERWWYLLNPGDSEPCASFLQQNPLIVQTPEGLMGHLMAGIPTEHPGAEVAEIRRHYGARGLKGMLVSRRCGGSPLLIPFPAGEAEEGQAGAGASS